MSRHKLMLGVAIGSTIASGVAWVVSIATDSGWPLVLGLHVGGAVLTAVLVARPRRALAFALGLTVPLLGPLAAALATLVTGRGGADLLHDPHAPPARVDGVELARRLTSCLPVCEALASTNVEARRQALAKLTNRAAPADLANLRWARTLGSGEAAVEIALAVEEIGARFEQRTTVARAAATSTPTFTTLTNLVRIITDSITSGVIDASLVARIADEGCRHHDAALSLAPARANELLRERVRLELAVDRPHAALELLTRSGVVFDSDPELDALFREAAYATRRFDLVWEVANAGA